jgi:hypothetical protein
VEEEKLKRERERERMCSSRYIISISICLWHRWPYRWPLLQTWRAAAAQVDWLSFHLYLGALALISSSPMGCYKNGQPKSVETTGRVIFLFPFFFTNFNKVPTKHKRGG